MSLDYTCYTAGRRRVSCAAIQHHASPFQLLVTDADTRRRIPAGRQVPDSSYVWGWRQRRGLADVEAAILNRDEARLATLTRDELLGCCELDVSEFEAEPEFLLEIQSKQHRDYFLAAKCRYDTRTAAGGNQLAWNLQRAVCRAIARAAGGLLEDAQLGRFRLVSAVEPVR